MRTTAEIKAKLGKESIDYIKVGVSIWMASCGENI